jgi:hypothetical protein
MRRLSRIVKWKRLEGRGHVVLGRIIPLFNFGTGENQEKSE